MWINNYSCLFVELACIIPKFFWISNLCLIHPWILIVQHKPAFISINHEYMIISLGLVISKDINYHKNSMITYILDKCLQFTQRIFIWIQIEISIDGEANIMFETYQSVKQWICFKILYFMKKCMQDILVNFAAVIPLIKKHIQR